MKLSVELDNGGDFESSRDRMGDSVRFCDVGLRSYFCIPQNYSRLYATFSDKPMAGAYRLRFDEGGSFCVNSRWWEYMFMTTRAWLKRKGFGIYDGDVLYLRLEVIL